VCTSEYYTQSMRVRINNFLADTYVWYFSYNNNVSISLNYYNAVYRTYCLYYINQVTFICLSPIREFNSLSSERRSSIAFNRTINYNNYGTENALYAERITADSNPVCFMGVLVDRLFFIFRVYQQLVIFPEQREVKPFFLFVGV